MRPLKQHGVVLHAKKASLMFFFIITILLEHSAVVADLPHISAPNECKGWYSGNFQALAGCDVCDDDCRKGGSPKCTSTCGPLIKTKKNLPSEVISARLSYRLETELRKEACRGVSQHSDSHGSGCPPGSSSCSSKRILVSRMAGTLPNCRGEGFSRVSSEILYKYEHSGGDHVPRSLPQGNGTDKMQGNAFFCRSLNGKLRMPQKLQLSAKQISETSRSAIHAMMKQIMNNDFLNIFTTVHTNMRYVIIPDKDEGEPEFVLLRFKRSFQREYKGSCRLNWKVNF